MLECDDASWPTCTTRARSMFGAVGRTERDVYDQLLHLRVVDLLYVSLSGTAFGYCHGGRRCCLIGHTLMIGVCCSM